MKTSSTSLRQHGEPVTDTAPPTGDEVVQARTELHDLAHDLRWTWHPEAQSLFRALDPEAWESSGHNPVRVLRRLSAARLGEALADPDYRVSLRAVSDEFAAFRRSTSGWFESVHEDRRLTVALFSAEIGLADCLPIAAGGLGAVTGEHLKTSSALGLPVVGIGLRYAETSQQWLDDAAWQHESWETVPPQDLPLTSAHDRIGFPLEIRVPLPGGDVHARVWHGRVGRSRLVLLDTDLPKNRPADRAITRRIYPDGHAARFRQYLVLGVGGFRALGALGIDPRIVHMNEGHTALAALARIGSLVARQRLTFDEARLAAAPSLVFTTHTPVPAGHDYFPPDLAREFLAPVAAELGVDAETLVALGRHDPDDPADTFCPTVLALRLAGYRNGVSRLHAEVTRQMWRGLWPRVPRHEIPVAHVTNGVHVRSWIGPEMAEVLDEGLGSDWGHSRSGAISWAGVRDVAPGRLWAARCAQRARHVDEARRWHELQAARRGHRHAADDPAHPHLDPDALTIAFVGRFVAYKRPALLLADRERLIRILGDDTRPVQIVFAGRAHPTDYSGKRILRDVVTFARRAGLAHRLVFLDDFDMRMDHWLSQGADVWLNTPRRPDEACGIAGMKSGLNGAMNFSTVDGWWDEVWEPAVPGRAVRGWAIGGRAGYRDTDTQDAADAAALYDVLEHEIVPTFYDRGASGLPARWVANVAESMATLGPLWTSTRMVMDYTTDAYLPGSTRSSRLTDRRAVRAREAARYLARAREAWPAVRVGPVEVTGTGDDVTATTEIDLAGLLPREVTAQFWVDTGDGGTPVPAVVRPRDRNSPPSRYLMRADHLRAPAGAAVAARLLPSHPSLDDPLSTGLITWSD